jgi:WhiB family redox-sensing transcriptional regulator
MVGDWEDQAACKGTPSQWWFPSGNPPTEALQLCQHCQVRIDCLAYAIANDIRVGVWGGELMSRYHRRRDRAINALRTRAEHSRRTA